MSFLKNLEKNVKEWHVLIIVGLAILAYVMYDYSCKKNMLLSNYQGVSSQRLTPASLGANAGANAGAPAPARRLEERWVLCLKRAGCCVQCSLV